MSNRYWIFVDTLDGLNASYDIHTTIMMNHLSRDNVILEYTILSVSNQRKQFGRGRQAIIIALQQDRYIIIEYTTESMASSMIHQKFTENKDIIHQSASRHPDCLRE